MGNSYEALVKDLRSMRGKWKSPTPKGPAGHTQIEVEWRAVVSLNHSDESRVIGMIIEVGATAPGGELHALVDHRSIPVDVLRAIADIRESFDLWRDGRALSFSLPSYLTSKGETREDWQR